MGVTFAGPIAAAPQADLAPHARAPPQPRVKPQIGNQALLRQLQPKLTIGAVDDPLEHEADAVAEQVMRAPDPAAGPVGIRLSRKCDTCEAEEKVQTKCASCDGEEKIQTKREDDHDSSEEAPAAVDEALRQPGRPLDEPTRALFEARLDTDLSGVRVHTGQAADRSAKSVDAVGYTVGQDVVFADGRFAPGSRDGQKLLAHELAHVVQQGGGGKPGLRREAATSQSPVARLADLPSVDEAQRAPNGSGRPKASLTANASSYSPERKCAPDTANGQQVIAHKLVHEARRQATVPKLRRGPPDDSRPPASGSGGDTKLPVRVPYGSTPLSAVARDWRRSHPETSGDLNLIVVKFSWSSEGMAHAQNTTLEVPILNWPGVAHSEKVMDEVFRDFRKNNPGAQITVHGIFSERQFCGGAQGCHTYLMKTYPQATKEFAYNYQTEGFADWPKPGEKTSTTRSVIAARIEAFRDSKADVDHSADKDPNPVFEDAGGRIENKAKKPPAESGETAKDSDKSPPQTKPPGTEPPAQDPEAKAPVEDPAKASPTKQPTETQPNRPPVDPPPAKRPPPDEPPAKRPPQEEPAAKRPPVQEPRSSPPGADPPASRTRPRPAGGSRPGGESGKPAKPGNPVTEKPGAKAPAVRTEEGGAEPSHGGGAKSVHAANRALDAGLGRLSGEMMKRAGEANQDKDVTDMLNTVNTVLDVHALVSDPKGFAANKIKTYLLDSVFSHFREKLARDEATWEAHFPDAAEVARNPLQTGVSLEQYRARYERARATYVAMRQQGSRRWVALGYQLQHSNLSRLEQNELIKKALREKDAPEAQQQYADAKAYYAAALATVVNALHDLKKALSTQRRDLIRSLNQRSKILSDVGDTCQNLSRDLLAFAWWPPAEMASWDFDQLSEGFSGLADGIDRFAWEIDMRNTAYETAADGPNAALANVDAENL